MKDEFDLAVLGGGLSGLGVALEASNSGTQILLLERETIGSGASSNSLRIVHGGLRYLQHADLPRVIHSLQSQAEVIRRFPEYVKPLRCFIALKGSGLKRRPFVDVAALGYRSLSRWFTGRSNDTRVLCSVEASRRVPPLAELFRYGVLQWFDALVTDPAALMSALAQSLRDSGVETLQGEVVAKVVRLGEGFEIHTEAGNVYRAKSVVNTTGAWIDSFDSPIPRDVRQKWAMGFNIVVSKQLDPETAVALEGGQGRAFFCVPRDDGSAIGTWYYPLQDGGNEAPREEQIQSALDEWNSLCEPFTLSLSDIRNVEWGILPLERLTSHGECVLVGTEQVSEHRHYVRVLSTKFTTFLPQARRALLKLPK